MIDRWDLTDTPPERVKELLQVLEAEQLPNVERGKILRATAGCHGLKRILTGAAGYGAEQPAGRGRANDWENSHGH
jgi:hypothetical protein